MIVDRRKAFRQGLLGKKHNDIVRTYIVDENNKEIYTGCVSTDDGATHLKSEYQTLQDDIFGYIKNKYSYIPSALEVVINTGFIELEKLVCCKMEDILGHKLDINAKFIRQESNNGIAFHADYVNPEFKNDMPTISFSVIQGTENKLIYTCEIRPFTVYCRCRYITPSIDMAVNNYKIIATTIVYDIKTGELKYEYATKVMPLKFNNGRRFRYTVLPVYTTSYDEDNVNLYNSINIPGNKMFTYPNVVMDMAVEEELSHRNVEYDFTFKIIDMGIPTVEDGVKSGYAGLTIPILEPNWRYGNDNVKKPPKFTIVVDDNDVSHIFKTDEIKK